MTSSWFLIHTEGYVVSIKMDHEETGCRAVEWIQLV